MPHKTKMPTTTIQLEYWFSQAAVRVWKIPQFHLPFPLWNASQLPLREAVEIRNEVAHPESAPSGFGGVNRTDALFRGTQA